MKKKQMISKKRQTVGYLMVGLTLSASLQPAFASTVPVQNISNPNGQGISHNKLQKFNVDEQGLILNNSTVSGQSKLGGTVAKNPSLSKSAKLIINEVSGREKSNLKGKIEVFGQKADVMIANPNGIECDGCGFINTSKATLTTGKPDVGFLTGKLNKIEVREGTVTIGPKGMDAAETDYVEVISRATDLQGMLKAKDLTLIQGANRIDYNNSEIKDIGGPIEMVTRPNVAIDTKALGGMYAERIRLVATENGVKANLANITSTKGDIDINIAGDIQLGNIKSKERIGIVSANNNILSNNNTINIVKNAKIESGTTTQIDAENIENKGTIAANKDLLILSNKVINERGTISAKNNLWIQKDAEGKRGELLENKAGTISTQTGDLIIRQDKVVNKGDSSYFAWSNEIPLLRSIDDFLGLDYDYNAAGNKVFSAYYGNVSLFNALTWFNDVNLDQNAFILTGKREYKKNFWSGTDTLENNKSKISSGKNVYINSDSLDHSLAEISAKKDIVLTGGSLNIENFYLGTENTYKQFEAKNLPTNLNGKTQLDFIYDLYRHSYGNGVSAQFINFKNSLSKYASTQQIYNDLKAQFPLITSAIEFKKIDMNYVEEAKTFDTTERIPSIIQAGGNLVLDYSRDINIHSSNQQKYKEIMEDQNSQNKFTLKGKNIVINGNNINNIGKIYATDSVSVVANNAINFSNSDIETSIYNGNISLAAINNINLLNGSVYGKNIDIISRQGDLFIAAPTSQKVISRIGTYDLFDLQGGNINLSAGKNIYFQDVYFKNGNNFSAIAGNNIEIKNNDDFFGNYVNTYHKDKSSQKAYINSMLSSMNKLNYTGEVLFKAGKDLNIQGVSIKAGKGIDLLAGSVINLSPRKISQILKEEYFFDSHDERFLSDLFSNSTINIQGKNIDLTAATIKSDQNIAIYSIGDLYLGSVKSQKLDPNNADGNNFDDIHLVSNIEANKGININTGGKLTAVASKFKSANGRIELTAQGLMEFLSVANKYYREFSNGYEERVTQQVATLDTNGWYLDLISLSSILFQGTHLKTNSSIYAQALGGYLFAQAMEQTYNYQKTEKKKKKWYKGGGTTTLVTTKSERTYKPAQFSAGYNINFVSRDDMNFQASVINAGNNLSFQSLSGKINFQGVKESFFNQFYGISTGLFINKTHDRGKSSEVWLLPSINYGSALTAESAQGISVDIKEENRSSLKGALALIGGKAGLSWYEELAKTNNVSWNRVEDTYHSWSNKQIELDPVFAAVLTIAIGAVTTGAGWSAVAGDWLKTLAGSNKLAGSLLYGMGTSGMNALTTKAGLSLVKNQGNLSKTFDELASSSSVKSIVSSIVTGGLLAGFDKSLGLENSATSSGLPVAPLLDNGNWSKVAARVLGQSLISSGANTAFYGGSFGDQFVDALLSNSATEIHAAGADLIGDANLIGKYGHVLGVPGKMVSHGVVAAIVAEIGGGNGKGAAAGAIAAELAAISFGDNYTFQGFSKDAQAATMKVIGAISGAVLTNSASGVNSAASAAEMVDRYNRMLHEEEKHLIKGLAKDEEAHARLLTAACGLVKCSSGFKKGTQSYLWALDLETKGISDDYALERQILRNHGGAEAFVYGYFDRIKDFNDRYDVGTRAMGVLDVIGGASLAGAGASYCLGSGGFGCVAGGGAAALMGSDYITTGLDSIISGQSAGTKGSLLLQTMGLSPETAELVYGLVGLNTELKSAANVIKYLEKNGAVSGLSTGKSALNQQYLDELTKQGVKFTKENIVKMEKLSDGRIIFLETGNAEAGLNHILSRHVSQFLDKGISAEKIPDVLFTALDKGKIIGYQGTGKGRPIYEFNYEGKVQRISITVGDNGFIVAANPNSGVK